ncbi:MAG: hypothetical protein ILP14_03840 [Oscillospiraceae bacterium]|nr:hypothetical protein [Oscillospiraceae bacterium]
MLRIVAAMFAAAFPAFAVIVFSGILFFVFLFPLFLAKAGIAYFSKRQMKSIQQQQLEDNRAEQQMRKQDPLFSLAGFYADVQNKQSIIRFAIGLQDMAALALDDEVEQQISAHLSQYLDLINMINMETKKICLTGYRVTQHFQEAEVKVGIVLLAEKNGKVVKQK